MIISYMEVQDPPIVSKAPPGMRALGLMSKFVGSHPACRNLLGSSRMHNGWTTLKKPTRWHESVRRPAIRPMMALHLNSDANTRATAETGPLLMVILEGSDGHPKYIIDILSDIRVRDVRICAIGQIAYISVGKVQYNVTVAPLADEVEAVISGQPPEPLHLHRQLNLAASKPSVNLIDDVIDVHVDISESLDA